MNPGHEERAETLPVSVFYIADREQDRIGSSLASIHGWVREIVVVVCHEEDPTVQLAREHGAKVFVNRWAGFGPQKRYAEEQCSERWLLNLDADETVSPELRRELFDLFRSGVPSMEAYRFPVRNQFAFEERPPRWAYAKSPVRLYDRERARFRDHVIHDSVIPHDDSARWRVGELKGEVYHCSFRNLSHFIDKLNNYSDSQAQVLIEAGKHPSNVRVISELFLQFFKSYFLRRYCLHGSQGFFYACMFASIRMARLAKVREHFMISRNREHQG